MSAYQLLLLLILLVLIAVALVLSLPARRSRVRSGPPAERQFFGPGFRDDDQYWYLGGFLYNNPDDPALFVINRWGIGITVNLGHPMGTAAAVSILLGLMVLAILPALFPGLNTSQYGCHPSGCSNPFPPLP